MRHIRSFVRRQGRITKAQQRAFELYWSRYGLALPINIASWSDIFQREGDVVLEIGFGMGQSLLEMARDNPDKNYLGIEVHEPGVGNLLNQAAEADLANLKLFCADAVEVLEQIPNGSLSRVNIFFPDPWHKKRHHKRRLIQSPFIASLCDKLAPEGILHVATDWEEYALHILAVLNAEPRLNNLATDGDYILQTDRPTTKFERRGVKLGHGVWDLQFTRLAETAR